MNTIRVASFDIGKKNFAFCVEEIDVDALTTLANIPSLQRYLRGGGCTPEFALLLKQVCGAGRIILIDNVDLTIGCAPAEKKHKKKTYLDPQVFLNMNQCLDSHKEVWDTCTSFIIEQQMSFGAQRNIMALKLGQHCYSYFTFQYASFKTTLEFPAYHKTRVLGAPKKLSKPERKRWAVEKAMQVLADRDDLKTMSLMASRSKADDMADNVLMLQAFKYLVFVDKSM